MTDPTTAALAEQRAEVLARIASLTRRFETIVDASTWTTHDDEHDPEGATVGFERAQTQSALDFARRELRDVDEAIERLRQGRYGFCEHCGQKVTQERLSALPATRTCIECANRS